MSTPDETGADACEDRADGASQLQPEDTLIDRGIDDVLDEGFSPPEEPHAPSAFDPSEGMDQLLAEEEPDPASRINVLLDEGERHRSDRAARVTEFPEQAEVGRAQAGRLVAPDRGFGEDAEAELLAEDVGIDGGAPAPEEAAIHILDETE